MQDVVELLNKTASLWFFKEPALYRTFCLHELRKNTGINVPFRSGQKRIEYNPALLSKINEVQIKKLFTREVTRCALAHPYQRRPKPFDAEIAYLASNLVIDQPKSFLHSHNLEERQCFEYYYYNLYEQMHEEDEDDDDDSDEECLGAEGSPGPSAPGGLGSGGKIDSEIKIKCDGNDGDGNNGNKSSNSADKTSEDKKDKKSDTENDDGNGNETSNGDDGDDGNNDNETDDSKDDESSENDGDNSKNKKGDGDSNDEKNGNDNESENKDGEYDGTGGDATGLWRYDADAIEDAKETLKNFESSLNSSKVRDTRPYNLDELIAQKKERLPKYINILHLFRGAVTSSMTHLTRMRPSRRSGFLQPGKKHELLPSILCAIDTSGSVETEAVEKMLSQVWGVFKSGVEKIDIITFDVKVNTSRPIHYKKNKKKLHIVGRGGTDFQPVINYFEQSRKYDGLVVMTDGIAPKPKLKYKNTKRKTLWFIYGKKLDEKNKLELTQTGFYAFMEI